jgi:hypothetical protein
MKLLGLCHWSRCACRSIREITPHSPASGQGCGISGSDGKTHADHGMVGEIVIE